MARDLIELAREVVRGETAAVAGLESRLGPEFLAAVECLHGCRGKVVVSGVGKSGLLAHKLAATLTSTGTPAVFLHPADALHGDAGLFASGDVALFLSKSGASDELLALLPYLERHGIPLVSIVATPGSALGRKSGVCLVTGPVREVCPMDLTPDDQHHGGPGDGRLSRRGAARAARFQGRGLPLPAPGRGHRALRGAPRRGADARGRRAAAGGGERPAARGDARDHGQAARHHDRAGRRRTARRRDHRR